MTKILIAIIALLLLTQIAVAQNDELMRLTKYQLEAKDPGMAALLGVISPLPGLGHYYAGAWDRAEYFIAPYVLGIGAIAVGSQLKEPLEMGYSEELSSGGALVILIGLTTVLVVKIIEPFDAHKSAVKYNAKLLEKYKLDLSFRKTDKAIAVAYRF